MSKGSLNLQDSFLNQVRREGILVRITLLDGREFRGRVKGFDNFTLVVVGETNEYHLIYKHAVGQIVSPKPIHGTTSRKGAPGGHDGQDGNGENTQDLQSDSEDIEYSSAEDLDARPEPQAPKRKSGFNPLKLDRIQVRRDEE